MKKFLICLSLIFISLSLAAQSDKRQKKRQSPNEIILNECYIKADSCYKCDNYSDAIMYAAKGIGEIKNIKRYKNHFYDLRMLEVISYMNLNEFDKALEILSELERLTLTAWHQAKIYLNKYFCHFELKEWDHAISNAEDCLRIVGNWDDSEDIIFALKKGIAKSYSCIGQFEISEEYYSIALEYAKEFCPYEDYISCCFEIYKVFYDLWYSKFVIGVLSELIAYHETNYPIDEHYCYLLAQRAHNYCQLSNFELAYESFKDVLEIYHSLDEKIYNPEYCFEAETYSTIAFINSRLGNFNEAYHYLDLSERSYAEHSEQLYNKNINNLLYDRVVIMINEGTKDVEASKIIKNLIADAIGNGVHESWLSIAYYNLGLTLTSQNENEALEAFNSALPLLAKYYGSGTQFAKALNQVARIYNNKEDGDTALKYYEAALDIYRKFSTYDNYSLVETLCNASRCALNFGEIGRAISWAEEARQIQKTTSMGIVDLEAWSVLLDSYSQVRNTDEYKLVYDEYKLYSNNGSESLDFARRELYRLYNIVDVEGAIDYVHSLETSYRNPDLLKMHNITIDRYVFPEYNYRFNHCMESWQTDYSYWSLSDFADCLIDLGEYDSANIILKSIYDVAKVDTEYLVNSCWASRECDDTEQLQKIINTIVETFRRQLKAVIGMTTSEKEEYWKKMSYLKNILGMFRNQIPITKQLFDISLIYKNFLINSDITFLRKLEHNGNEKVRNLAGELRATKDLLVSFESHDLNIDSLKIREIEINREIVQNLKSLSDFEYGSHVCCDSLSALLAPNEVVIEIADYSTTLSKNYVAMLLRKDWKEPVLIELGEESKFTSISNKPIKKLYDPSLPFSTELYELIWEPITQYLNKSDIVYISPSGIIGMLAIEALSSDKGVYVSDIYDIKRISSPSYILEQKKECKYTTSCVFGGVQYDSNAISNSTAEHATWDTGYLMDRSVNEDIPYLPATKIEAEKISGILTDMKAEVSLYTGLDANEYVFKDLSGGKTEIIHIATHGFYIPKIESNSYRYYDEKAATLAMERSGLMLAGANNAWNGKLTPGVEDGILTASEIAELDLSNTGLVVMSACETGLGEITEVGIEGLQRAFKSAGVETLIMSLWKVDDKATELLMRDFYTHLLK